SLTADALTDRWAAVLEAAAFSPVRAQVLPTAAPPTVTDDLRTTVTRLASLLPQIAALFGIEPKQGGSSPKPLRPTKPTAKAAAKPSKPTAKAGGQPPATPKPDATEVTAEPLSAEPDAVGADQVDESTTAEIVASIEAEAATVVEDAVAAPEELPVVTADDAETAPTNTED
ncbi:MAG: hypothetical protein JWN99_715, partial [Ilumatobacteraceae bacterium]|nr:hypothetical protein [Ilumatobacteraceae bacterium]